MWRFLTLVGFALLLASMNADARLFSGAGGAVPTGFVCQFLGSTTDESCITPANTSQNLGPAGGFIWNFSNTGCDANSPANCPILLSGSDDGYRAYQAVYRTAGPTIFLTRKFPTCGVAWGYFAAGLNFTNFAASPGVKLTGYFIDTTSSTDLGSMQGLGAGIANGDSATIALQPTPLNCWPDQAKIKTSGNTITAATGVIVQDNPTSKATIEFDGPADGGAAANDTLNGGTWGALRIGDGATGITLENLTVNGTDCNSDGTSGILSGNGNATVTLTNFTVHDCGDGGTPGQNHLAYLSATDVSDDAAATVLITGANLYNVHSGGWGLKMRPLGITVQNHVTQSYIYCAVSGINCRQNGVVDMPCGGNYLIDFSVLERGPGEGASDGDTNWYISRALEEPVSTSPPTCPPRASVNSFTFNKVIAIWDGPIPLSSNPVPVLFCLGVSSAGVCNQNTPAGTTCVWSNSVVVSDLANGAVFDPTNLGGSAGCAGTGCSYVAGKCTDSNNTRWYQTRLIAAQNEGWLNTTDRNGNTCTSGNGCAFPFLPNHM